MIRLRIMGPMTAAAAIAAFAASSGCNILVPVSYALKGPDKVPAVATIPDKPTLVYVDDRANVMARTSLRQIVADRTSQELMVHEVVARTISPRDAMALVRTETNDKPMAMEEIGRKVGAEQLIYVEMSSFVLSPDGFTPKPQAVCYVRVIDVATRTRVFPAPDSMDPAHGLQVFMREVNGDLLRSTSGRRQLEEGLAVEVGVQLAQMFYEHDKLGSTLK